MDMDTGMDTDILMTMKMKCGGKEFLRSNKIVEHQ
jgi:hypothetical protein